MTNAPASFRDIVNLWPRRSDLRRELLRFAADDRPRGPKGTPVTPSVRYWVQVDLIPTHWFGPLVKAARARGFDGVTMKLLYRLDNERAERNP